MQHHDCITARPGANNRGVFGAVPPAPYSNTLIPIPLQQHLYSSTFTVTSLQQANGRGVSRAAAPAPRPAPPGAGSWRAAPAPRPTRRCAPSPSPSQIRYGPSLSGGLAPSCSTWNRHAHLIAPRGSAAERRPTRSARCAPPVAPPPAARQPAQRARARRSRPLAVRAGARAGPAVSGALISTPPCILPW